MDPFGILSSVEPVVKNAQFVKINENKISGLADKINSRFGKGLNSQDLTGFASTGNLKRDVQLVFIQDVVNFCFWPGKNQPKWEVEWPKGNVTPGGWYGLAACFKRALSENVPILDAEYLSKIELEDVKNIFRGKDNVEMPLLKERQENLREAGRVLQKKFNGQFIDLIALNNYDSAKIVNSILENFPSFRDISPFGGNKVKFLKRAQICVIDAYYLMPEIKNMDKLTACADYKLPQVLRMFGILEYEKSLAEKVDNMIELPHDSREEIEIRAGTIWAVELLKQRLKKLTASEVDNTIWLISQGVQDQAKPYHRTRTIFY